LPFAPMRVWALNAVLYGLESGLTTILPVSNLVTNQFSALTCVKLNVRGSEWFCRVLQVRYVVLSN
jgi:hypothetical protein